MSMQPHASTDQVLWEIRDGVGHLQLNRPKAINALSREMIRALTELLTAWRDDDQVSEIELTAAGERGFSAGADVRWKREQLVTQPEEAMAYLDEEYRMDLLFATYPKPITSHLFKVTMGAGLGCSTRAGRRIATAELSAAMPENQIGMWPDSGMAYEMARMPGEVGTYLAMSGATIDAPSALFAGLVDEVEGDPDPQASWLAKAQGWIDECFTGDDPAQIVARLEAHQHPDARQAAEQIRALCPYSVCIALAAIRRAAEAKDLAEVLAMDSRIGRTVLMRPDFAEGVRAQLVDKDRNPTWQHTAIEDVKPAEVAQAFV